ncbi:hypothetical protein F2Q70_00027825 [Brassica cretica]|uniref:GRF-type domain-containing protein n=1 Tax=Brassica cretica TaxID=69181 RepID=A0A8S9LHY5_BRACR|nr:hypothetical protein F2Q70_00027825 [Brassica cretica]
MDPRIPYSQSAGYIGLLHSQHEIVHHENSPYESFHSGSSQIPQFSSQQCEAPTPPTDTPVERGRRHKWTPAEDEMLISAWLNTSKDAIVGNNQKSGTFWKRVSLNMGLDYSYSQPSQSEEFGGDESDNDYNEIEALIQQDQAQLDYVNAQEFVYPPQPEVEFGFPHTCYCGSQPQIATSYSTTDPGRRYYTCTNVDDGECHVWKWWDEAVMEEMRARDRHTLQLAEKVDSLNFLSDYETDQKLVRLENMVCIVLIFI